MSNKDLDLFKKFKEGDDSILETVYDRNYSSFTKWIIKYAKEKYKFILSKEKADELFQDAIIIFYQKTRFSDFNLTSSIKTFLFGVGVNLVKKFIDKTFSNTNISIEDVVIVEHGEKIIEVDIDKLKALLSQVDGNCQNILHKTFMLEMNSQEIGAALRKSDVAIRASRKRCLEKLNELVKNKKLTIDYFILDKLFNNVESAGKRF